MRKNMSLTSGSIWKSMLMFSLPVLLSNVLQLFYDAFDAWTVGRFVGDTALAAVGSSGSLIFLLVGFFNGLFMGAGVVIARLFGAKDYDGLRKAIHTNVAFALVVGVFLTVVGVFLAPYILSLMDTPEDVFPQAVQYLRIYFCGAIFVVAYNMFVGTFHAVGDSRHPLYFLMISTGVNIVLDLLFVGVLHWGVGSAAAATTIAQGVSAVLCFRHLISCKEVYRLDIRQIRFHMPSLRAIIRMGAPSGVQNAMISLANVVVQSNINSFDSAAVAGCSAYTKWEGFAFLPVICFSQALTTFVSQNLGAGQNDRAKKGVVFGVICGTLMAEVVGGLSYLFAPQMITFFNDAPAVVDFGTRHMRTICLFYFLMAFSHCTAAVCRGLGKAVVPMYTMLTCWCVIRITYLTIALPIFPDLETVSWAYPITWACSSLVFLVYYKTIKWDKLSGSIHKE